MRNNFFFAHNAFRPAEKMMMKRLLDRADDAMKNGDRSGAIDCILKIYEAFDNTLIQKSHSKESSAIL